MAENIGTGISSKIRFGISSLLHPGSSLHQRVLHAGFWAFSLRITLRLLTTLQTIILARMLVPADFGLIGIALLMMGLMDSFSRTGIRAALIQREGDIRPYLDTAWTILILRGILLAGIIALASPLVGSFFRAPEAVIVIQVMGLALVIRGFGNIGIVYFEKELEFQKRFLYQLAETIPQVVVGITLAIVLQNVWALVYGTLAGKTVQTLASYMLHPYRPRLLLEWAKAKELYNFGKWVFGSGMLMYLRLHLDDIVVGRVLGTVSLGLYRMAYNLSQLVSTELTTVLNQVAFPAYSKLQSRQAALRLAYLDSLQLIALLAAPIASGLLIMAPALIWVVLGEKWMAIVPVFQLLVVWGLMRSLGASMGPLFMAVKRPDLSTKLQLLGLVFLVVLVIPMTVKWGIEGAALAVVISFGITYPVSVWVLIKTIDCPAMAYLKVLCIPVVCTLPMVAVLILSERALFTEPTIFGLVGSVGLGMVTYLGTIYLSDRMFGLGIGRILQQRVMTR